MKQYMKSVVTMALMLLFTLGVWAAPSVNIKKQLNGVDNNDAGEASSSISEGVCTLTVTPASGNYVTVDYITAYSVWDGSMAQAPRRALDLDNSTITVTASASNTDPSGETNYTFTVPTDGSDVEVIVNFQSRKTLTLAMVADIDDLTYNKAAQEPALTITDGDLNLVKDTHYTVAYSNNVNAGVNTAIATITGKGIYAATSVEKTFTINPKALTEEMVAPLADNMVYNGEAQKPEVSVTDDNDDLVYGTDYWTSYTDSINAGEARCEINGKGNYTGQINMYYTIGQANFGDVTIAAIDDQTYTGSQITPAVTVTFNDHAVSTEDYNVVYGENTNVGEGTVTLTSKDKNFTTTNTKGATFNIVAAAAAITASDQTVTFNGEAQAFTSYTIANGTAVVTYYSSEEARTAKTGGTTETPTNADTYYVQVTQGNNNYTSEPANATFTINQKALTDDMVTLSSTNFEYIGEAQVPSVTVKVDENTELSEDNGDYSVSYQKVVDGTATDVYAPIEAGNYNVVVTGMGNYTGTVTKQFSIGLTPATVTTVPVATNPTYTGVAQNLVIAGETENGNVVYSLTADGEYSETIPQATDAGSYTVYYKATGDANHLESSVASVDATIAQAKLSAVTIATIDDQTFTGSQITPDVTVTFNDNTVSTEDYNVVYGENTNVGEGTVTLTSKNKNFVASTDTDATTKKTATFNIVAAAAAITASDQTVTFNGEAQAFTSYTIASGTAVVTYYSTEEARTAKTGGTTEAPTNADTYYVQVTQGDNNYTSEPANATFTVNPKALTESMVEQGGDSFPYSGYTPEYSVSVKDGEENLTGDDYDCVIMQGETEVTPVNAGSYDVVVTGKRNYTGTITKTLTITKLQLTVTADDQTYNVGDDIELTVSYEGFVEGENEENLTTQPTASYGTADVSKPGSYTITVSGGEATNYDFVYQPGMLTINRLLNVSFSASNRWATYYGTEDLVTPTGLQAYQVTGVEGTTVNVSTIGYIPANTAVLLENKSNNEEWSDIPASAYTGATLTFESNQLMGSASPVDVASIAGGTVYILYDNMFKRSTSGTIPANRGYLVVTSSGNAPQLSITIGDETTGIVSIENGQMTIDNYTDGWYSIDGVKLNGQPQKPGLYIKNGKKVVIK